MKTWEITKKDLRILIRDARALFVLLVLPLVFITIIGMTMGKLLGWRNSNQVLSVGVVDAIDYDQIGGPGWDADEEDAKPQDGTQGANADSKDPSSSKTAAAKDAGDPPIDA